MLHCSHSVHVAIPEAVTHHSSYLSDDKIQSGSFSVSDCFLADRTATQYHHHHHHHQFISSAVGIIMSSVCPSVRLSVCYAVYCGSQRVGVHVAIPEAVTHLVKSCTSVFLIGKFLFVHSDTFAVVCVVQPQNAPKTSCKFSETQRTTPALVCGVLRRPTVID